MKSFPASRVERGIGSAWLRCSWSVLGARSAITVNCVRYPPCRALCDASAGCAVYFEKFSL